MNHQVGEDESLPAVGDVHRITIERHAQRAEHTEPDVGHPPSLAQVRRESPVKGRSGIVVPL